MSQPFIGEIRAFGFGFAPRNWAFCFGQLMPISQNQALFSLIGTTYGGNGQTTFGLPDLRGRVPWHVGNGTVLGQLAGAESVTLTAPQVPQHTHQVNASTDASTATSAAGNLLGAKGGRGAIDIYAPATNLTPLTPAAIGPSGPTGGAHDNMQPSLVLNFCICLFGVYPSRN